MKIEVVERVEIDISGPLRKLRLKGGWYVVGDGSLDTVDSEKEADFTNPTSCNPGGGARITSTKRAIGYERVSTMGQ